MKSAEPVSRRDFLKSLGRYSLMGALLTIPGWRLLKKRELGCLESKSPDKASCLQCAKRERCIKSGKN